MSHPASNAHARRVESLRRAGELAQAERPFAVVTVVHTEPSTSARTGNRAIVFPDGSMEGWVGGGCIQPTARREGLAALEEGEPRLVRITPDAAASQPNVRTAQMTCASEGTADLYIEPFLPRPTLVSAGDSPIIATLAAIATPLGFRFLAVDAAAGLNSEAIPHPRDTWLVVATFGEFDEDAVEAGVRLNLPYVGLVASERRAGSILSGLRDRGLGEEALRVVRSPAGLPIGASGQGEISLHHGRDRLAPCEAAPWPAERPRRPSGEGHRPRLRDDGRGGGRPARRRVRGAGLLLLLPWLQERVRSGARDVRGPNLCLMGIVGVVLGAGRSSRFGTPKQLLPFGDTTMLGQVVRNANASELDRVVVVLGRASGDLRGSVDFGRALVVENTAYGTGCASSLLAGMDAAGEDCEALVLLLGDQPGVRAEYIDSVLSEWSRRRPWASVTSYGGGLGHPFVFAREAFGHLRTLHGDKAVWKLIEAYPERVHRVEIGAPLPPDVDTPEDYELTLVHWRSGA
jgi:molybdenum cofactor cytidylyltransferase